MGFGVNHLTRAHDECDGACKILSVDVGLDYLVNPLEAISGQSNLFRSLDVGGDAAGDCGTKRIETVGARNSFAIADISLLGHDLT